MLCGVNTALVFDVATTQAVEDLLAKAIKLGKPIPLNTDALLQAAKKVTCSTAEWFASARNHALYANQGGIYDEILKFLKIKP